MTLRLPTSANPAVVALALACAAAGAAGAQQLIGYVNTRDADVTGVSDTMDGRAVLTGSASVTARDHTAAIALGRGGAVRVCQTSVVHLTESKSSDMAAPLLFSLDRGAMEIQMAGTLKDSIMTPDLRFTVVTAGPLDLRVRVARNGDTCVENRGNAAPTLDISDPFGEAMYQIAAGQHVLFEHGSVHEVVDKENYPCGCPETPKGLSLADALLASGGPGSAAPKSVAPAAAAPPVVAAPAAVVAPPAAAPAAAVAQPAAAAPPAADEQAQLQSAEQVAAQAAVRAAAARAAERHPFPAAISEGLAPAAEAPAPAAGQAHTVVTDTLSYSASESAGAGNDAAAAGKKTGAGSGPTAVSPPVRHDVFHVVGRFFKRLFGS